jgi:predicted dehydrogenase
VFDRLQAQNLQLSADGKTQATADQVGTAFRANYAAAFPELRIYSNHKEMLEKESPLDIVTTATPTLSSTPPTLESKASFARSRLRRR